MTPAVASGVPALRGGPLYAVVATCTAYGYLGFAVVGHALDALYGGHRRIHTLAPPDWDARETLPILVTTDRPERELSRWLAASGAPVLAFFDAPENLAAHALFCDGESLAASLRRATHGVACLAPARTGRVFDSEWRRADLRELAGAVLAALGAPSLRAEEVAARMLAGEGLAGPATVAEILRRRLGGEALALRAQSFSDAERDLLRGFASGYGPMLRGRAAALEWPRALFFTGEGGAGEIEMIGPPRHLVWGPYLHLPPGRWRAKVEFEVEGNFSGNAIEADVSDFSTRGRLAGGFARLPVRGLYRFELPFEVESPDAPLEIRVRLRESAIEGRFGLRRVTLAPAGVDLEIGPFGP